MPVLHLMVGLPASGKSTLARQMAAELGVMVFTPDEWIRLLGGGPDDQDLRARVEALQWEMAQRMLSLGLSVILENGFWTREERDRYRRTAAGLGASVQLHYLEADLDELKRRVARRNEALPSYALHVDPAELDAYAALFEPPAPDELTR
jgi:predicted kinase